MSMPQTPQTALYNLFLQIKNRRRLDWTISRSILLLALLAALILGVGVVGQLLRFELLSDVQTVLSVLTPLVLYSLFIERSVEVFMTVWRGKEADQLTLLLAQQKAIGGEDKTLVHQMELELKEYKTTSRDMAFTASVIFGILVSMAGVRGMAPFLDQTTLEDLVGWQRSFFSILDVFITGSLIGGGSDGIHKIMEVFTTFLDTTKNKAAGK